MLAADTGDDSLTRSAHNRSLLTEGSGPKLPSASGRVNDHHLFGTAAASGGQPTTCRRVLDTPGVSRMGPTELRGLDPRTGRQRAPDW